MAAGAWAITSVTGGIEYDVNGRLSERALWRWNRLRLMSAAEVAHRIGRALADVFGYGARDLRHLEPEPLTLARHTTPAVLRVPTNPSSYRAAAERVVCGCGDLFALAGADLEGPPQWNQDLSTGHTAPMSCGLKLDHRDPQIVGDIKYL